MEQRHLASRSLNNRLHAAASFQELAGRVERGELAVATAEKATAAPPLVGSLTRDDVVSLSVDAARTVAQGEWRHAVTLQRLVIAALRNVDATPAVLVLRRIAYPVWVDVVRQALITCPDARLLASAQAAGEELAAADRAADRSSSEADDEFALGILFLDPYSAGVALGPGVSVDPARLRWTVDQRARAHLGDEAHDEFDDDAVSWRMPPPLDGLHVADRYLKAAAANQSGEALARTLKARAQAVALLAALGEPVSPDDHLSLARRALELAPDDDPQLRLALLRHLQAYRVTPDKAELSRALPAPDELERRYGLFTAVEIVREAVELRRFADDPLGALEELGKASTLLSRACDRDRGWGFDTVLGLRIAIAGIREPGSDDDLQAFGRAVNRAFKVGDIDGEQFVCGLLAVARATCAQDRELQGLEVLRAAVKAAPAVQAQMPDEIAWLERLLQHNVAVEAAKDGEWSSALTGYVAALCSEVKLGCFELAGHTVHAIADCAGKPGVTPAMDALIALGTVAAELEVQGADEVTTWLQEIWAAAIAAHAPAQSEIELQPLLLLIQLAKGLRFSMSLAGGRAADAVDASKASLLADIAALEAEASADSGPGVGLGSEAEPSSVDDDFLLLAYRRTEDQAAAGDDAPTRLANLRERFDAHVAAQLLRRAEPLETTLLRVHDVQGALDERTALLIIHLGSDAHEHHAWRNLLVTRDSIDAQVVTTENIGADPLLVSESGGPWEHLSPAAGVVHAVRQGVYLDPLGSQVSLDGEDALASLHKHLGDHIIARLGDLADQGKNHLCIAGHGPLHSAPFHLAGPAGTTLADRWIVSYMPSLQLLRPTATLPRRPLSIASLGLGYEDRPWGLDAMRQSVEEATAVAARFQTEPLVDAKATKAALRNALTTARFVHLSAHGRLDVSAPAFQHVFLAPDDNSDGRLFAHEVLGLDLRGLELLALSACETALERFDSADNPRGLVAAFLLAGVHRIIGTLWPVAPDVSKRFFVVLYGTLADGAGVIEAYRAAQRETRTAFPEYRHWGAFHLIAGTPAHEQED